VVNRQRKASGDRTPLTPVFLGLRIGLHTLMTGLSVFVLVRGALLGLPHAGWIAAVALALLFSYLSGAFLLRSSPSVAMRLVWLALITGQVMLLSAMTADAAFLVFPLFFLQLHLLRSLAGILAVAFTTAVSIVLLAMHTGWNAGGVLGPIIGAAVAVAIGLGYRALFRETQERQKLIDDLIETRHELAARERETGVLAERERLAREIHDTVAQGLSSIQLLLHAAERGGPDALEHLRLARETAATNLAEARRFIRELSPPSLQEQTLPAALERLAQATSRDGLTVTFRLEGEESPLPMRLETALLRIAQASLSNVAQHANASRADITLTCLDDWVGLDIVDDGVGFDARSAGKSAETTPTSFGLIGLRSRVAELGGTLTIESRPGAGTAIAASFDHIQDGS